MSFIQWKWLKPQSVTYYRAAFFFLQHNAICFELCSVFLILYLMEQSIQYAYMYIWSMSEFALYLFIFIKPMNYLRLVIINIHDWLKFYWMRALLIGCLGGAFFALLFHVIDLIIDKISGICIVAGLFFTGQHIFAVIWNNKWQKRKEKAKEKCYIDRNRCIS